MSRELPSGLQVAPSILSADFARLAEQVQEVLDAGARLIHVDVMDGHFVPPITIGPLIVAAIAEQVHSAGGYLDCHLMIEKPERQITEFVQAGADGITVHFEATANLHYAVSQIKTAGCRAGVAINPGTAVNELEAIVDHIDLALCMTVNPGWGGQEFIAGSAEKIAELRRLLPDAVALEVDGGIDSQTAPICKDSGANVFVAGSAIFKKDDVAGSYVGIANSID